MKILYTDALIIVDMQYDFMPDGALPVPRSDNLAFKINDYIERFYYGIIVATRDWHPANHMSFKDNGGLFPAHCIQNTYGARIVDTLDLSESTKIISKGQDKDKEEYSAFLTGELDEYLKSKGIKRLFICGIATDYCVSGTVISALNLGYEVRLLLDACSGLDNSEEAIQNMLHNGAKPTTLIMLE